MEMLKTMSLSAPQARGRRRLGRPKRLGAGVRPAWRGCRVPYVDPDTGRSVRPAWRGCRPRRAPADGLRFIRPAGAGMPPAQGWVLDRKRRPPRRRGDRSNKGSLPDTSPKASPQARGSIQSFSIATQNNLVRPAHAGIDRLGCRDRGCVERLPRRRGDRSLIGGE